jgi:hypothetical protein
MIVLAGLVLYGVDFFLYRLWDIEAASVLRGLGMLIGLIGAGCGLLWFVSVPPLPEPGDGRDDA